MEEDRTLQDFPLSVATDEISDFITLVTDYF